MTVDSRTLGVVRDLATLARSGAGPRETLEIVTTLIVGIAGHQVGVSLRTRDREISTLASTALLVESCDVLHREHGEGPLLHMDRRLVLSHHLVSDGRWPVWAPAAAELGAASLAAVPMTRGAAGDLALVLYADSGEAFRDADADLLELLGAQAGVAYSTATERRQFDQAVAGRTVIGQAQGILMERCGLKPDAAFEVLRRYSRDTNTKLKDVAARLVETGGLEAYEVKR